MLCGSYYIAYTSRGIRFVNKFAVAWEKHLLDRSEGVFQTWRGRGISDAEQEAIMLRQTIADADWDTVKRHGGIEAAIKKVLQVEDQSASNNDPGSIDDCRLRGSSRCRRMGETAATQ